MVKTAKRRFFATLHGVMMKKEAVKTESSVERLGFLRFCRLKIPTDTFRPIDHGYVPENLPAPG
ncbi:hypothetical protein QY077_25420 [Klebsiella oxytoca]|uniref:hypothetical protein n=1 Tax=Klebsiella oxytoca TaxID=571 RepID=UPI0026722623|nr:hypothetical protein [Klebsiella oxytoca]WKW01397.1 hypothetical protein Q3F89_25370 [Klebsiella oxytoca]WMH90384.1 hypothetical protein QY077_25420 [Klebsiella oxytoca]